MRAILNWFLIIRMIGRLGETFQPILSANCLILLLILDPHRLHVVYDVEKASFILANGLLMTRRTFMNRKLT